jgi:hypothetical protein
MIEYVLLGAAALLVAAALVIIYRRRLVIPDEHPPVEIGRETLVQEPPVETGFAEVRNDLKNLRKSLNEMDRNMEETNKLMKGVVDGRRRK